MIAKYLRLTHNLSNNIIYYLNLNKCHGFYDSEIRFLNNNLKFHKVNLWLNEMIRIFDMESSPEDQINTDCSKREPLKSLCHISTLLKILITTALIKCNVYKRFCIFHSNTKLSLETGLPLI